ncbi:MAG: Trm112 family protein [Acidimicrobiaceae bacterium]|nr:Trm112 family protein [Acidimicrobiaceae bacterium]MXZ98010.1 Trm112 family protein [Acidimicrobiaceae bacterium]MYE76833.1 Trm112 family protein [Acidimicrobiaceae bacterium]MYE97258.1 Trm112 family protein [Acidimicrobiaceae bacterium]MYH43108.1 Trm112 family protein [Acidimicrobiaceae bacterium]
MTLEARLLEILACPSDKGPLLYFPDEGGLYNPRLRLLYRVEDGIPVMLLDEAVPVDDPEHERLLAKAEADGVGPTFEADRAGGPES